MAATTTSDLTLDLAAVATSSPDQVPVGSIATSSDTSHIDDVVLPSFDDIFTEASTTES